MTTQANTTRTAAVQPAIITKEEMSKVIRRSFRAMDPDEGVFAGELFYDLTLEEGSPVVVRVMTSISSSRGTSYGVGEDAIRVGLAARGGKNLMVLVTVKRIQTVDKNGKVTPTWQDNLRARIEDSIENYHEKEEYWRGRAGQVSPAPAPAPQPAAPVGPPPRDERARQVALLQALAQSQSPKADIFADMLRRLRPGALLSDKQLAWAESEAKRFVR